MKKVLTLVLALLLVFSLVGCTPKAAEGPKTVNVGICIYRFNDNFMTLYREELQRLFTEAETEDVKYNVEVVDGQDNMATQTEQVDTFLAKGVDVLIVNLVQTSSAETIVEKIDAAGVKCVLINREPSKEVLDSSENICYVGADASQSGTFQGEIVLELADKGDINGDGVVKYIMIMGDEENSDAQLRTEFSIKALVDAGVKVECLLQQSGHWDTAEGQEICATALAQFKNDIEVVFCNNDGMALGAYEAIVAAGRVVGEDIYLLGVDALDACVEMVNNGTMTGTVLNDHIGQAKGAFDAAMRYLNGQANDKKYTIPYVKVV